MEHVVFVSVVESLANLAADVQQIPDGEPFFARQHGRDTVALDVFHGGAELAIDFARAIHGGDVDTAEILGGFGFLQNALHDFFGLLTENVQAVSLQGNRLPTLRIAGFVDGAPIRFCKVPKNFEAADFRRHFFLPSPGKHPANALRKHTAIQFPGVGNNKDNVGRKCLRVTKVLGAADFADKRG